MSAVHPDPWLAGFVGVEAFRLDLDEAGVAAVAPMLKQILGGRSFVSTKVPTAATSTVHELGRLGFNVVDVNVTLRKPLATEAPNGPVRFATEDDEEAVAGIARSVMRSRFHLDPRFPAGAADALKEAWVRNFWRGERGAWMVVAEDDAGRVSGFLQLLHHRSTLVIDLIGVDSGARRRGLARSMMSFAEASCGPSDEVVVGTQVSNVSSLRLYENAGFRIRDTAYVLHAHGTS